MSLLTREKLQQFLPMAYSPAKGDQFNNTHAEGLHQGELTYISSPGGELAEAQSQESGLPALGTDLCMTLGWCLH